MKNIFHQKNISASSLFISQITLLKIPLNFSIFKIIYQHTYIKVGVSYSFVLFILLSTRFQFLHEIFYSTRINKVHTHNKICNFAFLLTSKLVVVETHLDKFTYKMEIVNAYSGMCRTWLYDGIQFIMYIHDIFNNKNRDDDNVLTSRWNRWNVGVQLNFLRVSFLKL